MTLAGFVPLSLCDYPGRVASVLFTQGCNFRCPWCHNPHLVPAEPCGGAAVCDTEAVIETLASRRARVDSVVVTGGEPTLHADLPAFLRRLRALGLHIKLDTNGSRPAVLRTLFAEHLLDYVAMDMKAPWARYAALTGVPACDTAALRDSVALIARSGVAHQFRTTRVDPLLSESDYADIRLQIPSSSPHVWQAFRPDVCLTPEKLIATRA
ncbi:MAG TPA: anaerobic ribonucleoside-triphosphate reductase activating protein [Kiritimatiellia bacterium]|nr:anaerobic ribonucleoside-triphosphate reductase activating protein [Kiritimatiellia bacterium]HRU71154.1 anaerobic ribonucleoside-triphosphate reductase activating protein [Kiritimatiellia bacterium]